MFFMAFKYVTIVLYFISREYSTSSRRFCCTSPSEVTITNNVGKADTIYITGVIKGDIVTVYNAATEGKVIGKKTVAGEKTDATISVSQLGSSEGSVYITITSLGMTESSRTEVSYSGEAVSEEPSANNITITNNSGKADTIYVCGLGPNDKINIYTAAIGGKLLGSATVDQLVKVNKKIKKVIF